jgi:hypothetical protein
MKTDERQIFGGTARSFGGADFLGAALVIAVNLLGSAIVSLYLVTPAEAANLGDKSETTSVNWMGLLICSSRSLSPTPVSSRGETQLFLTGNGPPRRRCSSLSSV